MGFFWTIVVLLILLALAWRYLGAYMVADMKKWERVVKESGIKAE